MNILSDLKNANIAKKVYECSGPVEIAIGISILQLKENNLPFNNKKLIELIQTVTNTIAQLPIGLLDNLQIEISPGEYVTIRIGDVPITQKVFNVQFCPDQSTVKLSYNNQTFIFSALKNDDVIFIDKNTVALNPVVKELPSTVEDYLGADSDAEGFTKDSEQKDPAGVAETPNVDNGIHD